MTAMNPSFSQRLRRIERTHDRINRNGGKVTIGKDGLIIVKPKMPKLVRSPIRSLVLTAFLIFSAKVAIYQALGQEAYLAKLAELAQGNGFDRTAAFFMQLEPATLWASAQINTLSQWISAVT